jgi:hypothetical protein
MSVVGGLAELMVCAVAAGEVFLDCLTLAEGLGTKYLKSLHKQEFATARNIHAAVAVHVVKFRAFNQAPLPLQHMRSSNA